MVADVAVGIVPVIPDAGITELQGQIRHIAGRTAFAEVADARDAEVANVLVAGAHELLELGVVRGDGVAEQTHQILSVGMRVAREVPALGTDYGFGTRLRLPETGLQREPRQPTGGI